MLINIEILKLKPNNWFLNSDKISKMRKIYKKKKNSVLPPILISKIHDEYSIIDGHSRAFVAWENGKQFINAEIQDLESIEGSSMLYKYIHDNSSLMGINKISDLQGKILNEEEHKVKWCQLCTSMLKSLENGEKPNLDNVFNRK